MARSQAAQPAPGAASGPPRRASASTVTPSKVARYWVSDEIDIRCSVVRPPASEGTANRSMSVSPFPVRASTTSRSAAAANCTWILAPSSTNPSPLDRAVSCTPRGLKPPPGSSHPTVAMASPEAIPASSPACCSREPACVIAPAAITQLTKWGSGASERPNSSYRTTPSMRLIPDPPALSGTMSPHSPSSPKRAHRSRAMPSGSSSSSRTRSSGESSPHRPLTISRSMSCSGVKSRSSITRSRVRPEASDHLGASRPPLLAAAKPRVVRR